MCNVETICPHPRSRQIGLPCLPANVAHADGDASLCATVEKVCKKCGKTFSRPPAHIGEFCSRNCFYNFRYKRTLNLAGCFFCGKEIRVSNWSLKNRKKHFCSFEHRILHQTKQIWINCDQCGKIFRKSQSQISYCKNNFCSHSCSEKFHVAEKHPLFIDGKIRTYGISWKEVSKSVRIRDGHKCVLCGKTQKENGKKLDVHHIKPIRLFKNIQAANNQNNLISLCQSCHRKQNPR